MIITKIFSYYDDKIQMNQCIAQLEDLTKFPFVSRLGHSETCRRLEGEDLSEIIPVYEDTLTDFIENEKHKR